VFWSTWWFRTTYVAVILFSVWCAYRYRLHRLAKQYSIRLEERVSERTRIARELHDTLLQSFQGLLLVLQSGINLLPDRPDVARARERLQGAIDQAEQAITERRDAVQGLRASTLETNDLAATLNALAAELAANQGGQNSPVFGVQVEGASRDLHPILRDDVYRIAGEALRNAFLHAQASRIEVDIRYGTERFRVRIRDDGKGIESQIVTNKGRTGHWGLRGMHERAKLVGGNLAVWSKPDSGTEIELIIPASTAYGKSTTERPGSPERELQ
jgi:signal transduction histidine kinase